MQLKDKSGVDQKFTDQGIEELNERDAEGLTFNPRSRGLQVQTYKSFFKCLFRVLNLCFSSFYFGYTIAYLGTFDFTVIINLYEIYNDQNTVEGLLQGITSIGAGVGALSASIVLKMLSRRNSVLFINFFAIIFGILVMFPNIYLFFVSRFFQGACIGLYSAIIPLLIKQYSPTEISGTFGALNQAFIAFGVFFVFAFQLILVQFNQQLDHWRVIFGFTLITIIIQTLLLLFFYKEQTPKYYLLHNRQEQCEQYMTKMYKQEFVQSVLKEKKADLGIGQKVTESGNQSQMQVQIPHSHHPNQEKGKKYRIATAIHLAVLQQFVGINCVIAYGVSIIAQILPSMSKVIPVILNLQAVLASVVSSMLLAKLGRKIILQTGTLMSSISIAMVATGFLVKPLQNTAGNGLIIAGLIIFMANFGLSLGPVVWLYIAEIVEPQIIPFSTLSNWVGASIVIITFPILSNAFGTPIPLFFFFTAWSFASLFVNQKLLIQTKGKTQKQIRQQYCRK